MTDSDRENLLTKLAGERKSSVDDARDAVKEVVGRLHRLARESQVAFVSAECFDRVLMATYALALTKTLGAELHVGNVPKGERKKELQDLASRLETFVRRGRLLGKPMTISRGAASDLHLLIPRVPIPGLRVQIATLPSRQELQEQPRQQVFPFDVVSPEAARAAAALIRHIAGRRKKKAQDEEEERGLPFYGFDPGGQRPNHQKRKAVAAAFDLAEQAGAQPKRQSDGLLAEITDLLWLAAGFPLISKDDDDEFEPLEWIMRFVLAVAGGHEEVERPKAPGMPATVGRGRRRKFPG